MATRFNLPHIDILSSATSNDYSSKGSVGSSAVRIHAEHGARLLNELNAAFEAIDAAGLSDERLSPSQGNYVEVELLRGTKTDVLLRKRQGIKPTAVNDVDDKRIVALFVPDHARTALKAILDDYRAGQLTTAGKPQKQSTVGPIEAFRRARLETLWTDDIAALPTDPQHEMWWAIWVERHNEVALDDVCERLKLRAAISDRRLYFPEAAVVPVFATRAAIELMTFATGIIGELRRATDNPVFFMEDTRDTQHEWTEDLATRIIWPGTDVPAVCLLDTGVNRGHSLLEPALSDTDMHTYENSWGTDDHDAHGSAMAGLALHGDLLAQLSDTEVRILSHRLESVKLLPPNGGDPNNPNSYGAITQAAVSLPEIQAPGRKRIYCMAITNDCVSGAHPSTWSAAIDQAASGTMIGDDHNAPRRLFVLSIGNTEAVGQMSAWTNQNSYPAEDPSQAWNAITVGGYTDLTTISDVGYEDWDSLANVGELSPHSRTSVGWLPNRSPFKPELVLEAGNRAVSPSRQEIITVDSLKMLSTGREVGRLPLVPFDGTSAAAAQAARLAARIAADHPEYWPETIRALMIHSAQYTVPMQDAIDAQTIRKERYKIVRQFGYGVPDYNRASASACDSLALVSQTKIQPFRKQGSGKFNECHYYKLPLPNAVLEQLNNELIELKITLSYFIEPNPGFSANVDPQRYQSYGLRFDLRRKGETLSQFKIRVNASEKDGAEVPSAPHQADNRWLFGPDSVSAGSLHCDTWSGPAVDLLGRDTLCIKPVGGWWRDRANADVVNKITRYALVITLKARNTEVDLYTPISLEMQPEIDVRAVII